MPIYEYRCSRCSHKLEALQKLSDAALTTCPACNEDSLVKQVSAAGFQLKGSGWYATDFRSSGGKPAAGGDAAAATESKPENAADSAKPATAPAESKSETKSGETKSAAGCGTSCACH